MGNVLLQTAFSGQSLPFGRSLRVEVVAVWAVRTVIQFYIGDSIAENPELSRMSKRLEICLKRL